MYRIMNDRESPVCVLNRDLHDLPVVISIPHSGVSMTDLMAQNLRKDAILANMDWYLPELYNFLENMGFTVVINRMSRYVIDPNRDLAGGTQQNYTKALIYEKTTFGRDYPYIWIRDGKAQWYGDPLSKKEQQLVRDAILDYVEMYMDMEMTMGEQSM